jgi:hypothetical protein
MEDAKTFTQICHRLGLRVGCYTSSGTILYETMLAEHPEAKDWLTLDRSGKPVTWGPLYYRYWANRRHPGFRALLREVVHFAVVEAKVDLVHFDNYGMGPSYEPYSVNQFREYLKKKYSPEERMRRFGSMEMDHCSRPHRLLPRTDTMVTRSLKTSSISAAKRWPTPFANSPTMGAR